MGHAILGVEGTYDRYDYFDEKNAALTQLEALILRIVRPPKGNVVAMAGRKRRRK